MVSLTEADSYLKPLNEQCWFEQSIDERTAHLLRATQIINTLAFIGTRTTQNAFPTEEWGFPDQIKWALIEQALDYSKGRDTQMEVDDLMTTASTVGGQHVSSNRTVDQEHIRNGITSFRAWGYLVPYLRDTNEIIFSRGD